MKNVFFLFIVVLITACKDKYESPVKPLATGYLVLEGVINAGNANTTLTLSRTTNLDNRAVQYEEGAQVKIEGEDNSLYFISEAGPGIYVANNLNLPVGRKYRLRIKTKNGKEYLSDYEAVRKTPSIDSVSWKREKGGVQLYINTNDPSGNTRYYQWQYDETWQIRSAYTSSLKYQITRGPQSQEIYSLVYRDQNTGFFDTSIYNCWQYYSSTSLLLGSSAKLGKDVINLPLLFIPETSRKVSVLYSIEVKQFSWSKEGYEFLERMKKNTEETGSIFDAQPSELKGNIRCITDPNEQVIGYVNISSIQEKRIFIKNDQVGNWRYQTGCSEVVIENISDSIINKAKFLMPTNPDKVGPGIVTFFAALPTCVDCTLSGTNVRPVFWP
jgi:hypothetical protein